MIPFELAQTLIVTAMALGAAALVVRRTIGRKKKQAQAPGCASCAAHAPGHSHPAPPPRA